MSDALPSREAIVAAAQQSIARGSKSFAAASTLFDRRARERAWLLYAWCRACDDIADGQDHGHGMTVIHDAPERLARITALTEAALAGQVVGDPAFDALRIVAAETRMPHAFARDLIAGFALDARDWRPRTEADLYKYCYHVAGVVGCMMAVAMGVDPDDRETLDRACDLGMAFQLANIARDIEEDDRVGRAYVPEDWFVEMDIPPGQHMRPPFRPRLAVLARRLAERAAAFEASARVGTPKLSFRSAWAVLSAAEIYGAIGREVAERGERAWDNRVTTSGWQKVKFIARAARAARGRARLYPPAPRDIAWVRPNR
ncbi:phytoene/squalene synthase family protein [Sphingomonas qilianensis]|uniref:Phytoene/squalene synthase family protein n=1 Tax=Sphingomonas qilianensis TaxID=1736690 RepID=A0ABU9XT64_9SPHN